MRQVFRRREQKLDRDIWRRKSRAFNGMLLRLAKISLRSSPKPTLDPLAWSNLHRCHYNTDWLLKNQIKGSQWPIHNSSRPFELWVSGFCWKRSNLQSKWVWKLVLYWFSLLSSVLSIQIWTYWFWFACFFAPWQEELHQMIVLVLTVQVSTPIKNRFTIILLCFSRWISYSLVW